MGKYYAIKLGGKYYFTIDNFVESIDDAIIFSKKQATKIINKIVIELKEDRQNLKLEAIYI